MKAHHHSSAARLKIYHGRRHTKKNKNALIARQPQAQKKASKKKRKSVQSSRFKTRYAKYWPFEKPTQFLKASPFWGGLQGARAIGGTHQ